MLSLGLCFNVRGENRLVNSNLKKQPTFRTSNMCNPALLLNSLSTSPNYVLSPLKYTVCAVTWLFCDSPVCDMKTSWRKCQTLSQLRSLYQIKMGCFFLLLFGRYFGFSKDNINQSKGNKKRVRKNKAIHQSVPTLGVQINQYINIQGLITAV